MIRSGRYRLDGLALFLVTVSMKVPRENCQLVGGVDESLVNSYDVRGLLRKVQHLDGEHNRYSELSSFAASHKRRASLDEYRNHGGRALRTGGTEEASLSRAGR